MRAAKVQASLRIRAVSPEPSLLAHTSSESRGTFREKARSLAPLNGWACAVKICHDGMLEDANSLDAAHKMLCFGKVTHDSPKIGVLVSIFVGFTLPAFNEATRKHMLPFLDSSEIFLFMIFFYNVLVQFLKHQYNEPMVATFRYVYLSCAGHLPLSRNQSYQFRECVLHCF